MPDYILRKLTMGKVPEIDITKEDYTIYEHANQVLSYAFRVEEKYEVVITNYIEFEKHLLELATRNMIQQEWSYYNFSQARLGLNIRLINLLTTIKLYLDSLAQNLEPFSSTIPNAKQTIKELRTKEYEAHLEYRFMEELRNHAQHVSLPIHSIPQNSEWTKLENGHLEYSIELISLKSLLATDKEFKKRVLEGFDDKVDLKSATRCYVECISNIHHSIRNLIQGSVKKSRQQIEEAQNKYSQQSTDTTGLHACSIEDNKIISQIPLFLGWDDVRIQLQRRNRKLVNLKRRYVTNIIRGESNT